MQQVFGGFANKPWEGPIPGKYVEDNKGFLFSLTKNTFHMIWKNFSNAYAMNGYYGPCFGGGIDLFIYDEANKVKKSSSKLGHTYFLSPEKIGEASTYLAGEATFCLEEIEVFNVVMSTPGV